MPAISQRTIRELLSAGESSRLDYKLLYHLRTDNNKDEFAKDVCAIANFVYQASGKGYIIIGANNSGTPIGVIHSDYSETTIQQIIGSRTDPPPIFQVHYETYSGVNLVIIEIRRNTSGPHQVKIGVKSLGFPTRRGSSNEAMDTIEVFQTMQVRGLNFLRSPSDYQALSPTAANTQIENDLVDALSDIGIQQSRIRTINLTGYSYLHFIKVINRRQWNFYISKSYRDENLQRMLWLDNSLGMLSRSIPLHRSIFIHLVNGSITNSYFTNMQQMSSKFVKVTIEPRITYFGLGQGATEASALKFMSVPKFYVTHIKSKDDIKMRVELILNWIGQQSQMFEDIRSCLH